MYRVNGEPRVRCRDVSRPFDAVLLIAFGGPQRRGDIRPFLENVVRGRRIPRERLDEVARHYELFDGVSPLTGLTKRQADGIAARLTARGLSLPVYVGMRNWHPLLVDTLQAMGQNGVRHVIGLIAAAHRSYSSCGQYRHNVLQAQEELTNAHREAPRIVYTSDWHVHPGFVRAVADRVRAAYTALPAALAEHARVLFTAHSIPSDMAHADTYRMQLLESARLVALDLGLDDERWSLVYQSRSGRPSDPWLEPDVNDYLRAARREGVRSVVLSPLGFVCDHIEVLYDLDYEARATCEEVGIAMARAAAVNDHPAFLNALTDAVCATYECYRRGIPLALVSAEHPTARELAPPRRGNDTVTR
ncbi:MAG: ferrochelatase [Luteitalea sp.]|nr:ferrochelatase [Luteitalea sp.]